MANGGSVTLNGLYNGPILIIRNNGEDIVTVHNDGRVEYHTDPRPEEAARLFWEALSQMSPVSMYREAKEDADRLVRQLDVLLNGEDFAAQQASLCDVVAQVQRAVRLRGGAPLLVGAILHWGEFWNRISQSFDSKQVDEVHACYLAAIRRAASEAAYSTLRQQAGAVDVAAIREVIDWLRTREGMRVNIGGLAAKLQAALTRPASSEPASGEAVKLAAILDGMTEGSYNLETLYEADQPDGDPFVRRAADLLREFAYTHPAEQVKVPEGMVLVLVPREPTEAMIAAIQKNWGQGSYIDMAKREWSAALAAAPGVEVHRG